MKLPGHGRLLVLAPLLLAACALGDVPLTPTAPPPVTVQPAPTLTFAGSCASTKELETWLQITSLLAADFLAQMNTAAGLDRATLYDSVIAMAQMRDSVFAAATPDCAIAAQLLLTDAMDQAVAAFQQVANGEMSDPREAIARFATQIEQVMALQTELAQRMEQQFREAAQATASAQP